MEVMLPTLIGFAAGCIGTYSFVPKVLKCWRTGETGAISLRMFAVRTFGALLWTFYGFVVGSLPVLIFSAAAGLVGAGLTAVDPVAGADVVVSSRAAMPDLLEGPRKGREEGRLELPSVDSCRGVLNKPSRQPMLKPSVSSLANKVLWRGLPLELLITNLPRRPPTTLGGCAFTALLAREPKAVRLSNHRIAGDTPTKLLRNHAGGLSR